jgi:hypothetical protein
MSSVVVTLILYLNSMNAESLTYSDRFHQCAAFQQICDPSGESREGGGRYSCRALLHHGCAIMEFLFDDGFTMQTSLPMERQRIMWVFVKTNSSSPSSPSALRLRGASSPVQHSV